MTYIFISLCIFALIFIGAILTAPMGYQTKRGFFYGKRKPYEDDDLDLLP